jgi:serine/threonine protein kinase
MLKSDNSDELQSLFLREVAVCATLEHPNVVEVIDAGQLEHDLYLVMEYVDGPSLAELLQALGRRGERLPVEVTCGIIAQVARGLGHAHDRALPDGTSLGIVHRDVASENVLISRSGLPKLVDFGLATLSGHNFTTPGTIRGRPRSLAPEQARGEKIDLRADIFALGAMMFELAAGQQLYPHESLAKMLWKVVGGDYDPIAPRLDGVDPDLIQIIQTALEVDPKDRYRSTREIERALDNFRAARGMRIDSSRIAAVINKTWDGITEIRKEHKEEAPGELEGRDLTLAGDSLDATSSSIQVPDYIVEAGRKAEAAASARRTPPNGLTARPKRPISGAPSKPRSDSTTLAEESTVTSGGSTPAQGIEPITEELGGVFAKPKGGGAYAYSAPREASDAPRRPPSVETPAPPRTPSKEPRDSKPRFLEASDAPAKRSTPPPPRTTTRPPRRALAPRWILVAASVALIALLVFAVVWLKSRT